MKVILENVSPYLGWLAALGFSVVVIVTVVIHYNYVGAKTIFQKRMTSIEKDPKKTTQQPFRKTISSRIWRFFIKACLIPIYREEWGKYQSWNSNSALRTPKPPKVKRKKHRKHGKSAKKSSIHECDHDHSQCERIKINVNGAHFETQLRTLNKFPDTLLGDPNQRLRYYDTTHDQYFFDRSRICFEWILHYYQSGGKLTRPDYIPNDIFYEEIKFFKLGKLSIQRYEKTEGWTKEITMDLPYNLYLRKLWLLFDIPESSMQATLVAILSIVVVLVSNAVFCLSTIPILRSRMDDEHVDDPFFIMESVCSIWFTIELVVRFISCPSRYRFIQDFLNLVDIIAVVPYYIEIAQIMWDYDTGNPNGSSSSLDAFRIVRLVRVFRVLKLSRHSKGLKILGLTLSSSFGELTLLVFFIIVAAIIFSSSMYCAEQDSEPNDFKSIPSGVYWALETLTTVGYGDYVPHTIAGKFIGGLCSIAGVLTIALPVPVIVSNFNHYYHQEVDEQIEHRTIPNTHVEGCPFLPGTLGSSAINNDRESDSDPEFEQLKFANRRPRGWFS